MNPHTGRRRVLHAGSALACSLVLPRVQACEFVTANFKIIHPWTRASAEGATSAAICMRFEEVVEADWLIGAQSPVCERADMGGAGAGPLVDFAIPADQSSALTESGTHLRLVGLRFPLEVGREYPLTLVFKKAGPVLAKLSIDYARFG